MLEIITGLTQLQSFVFFIYTLVLATVVAFVQESGGRMEKIELPGGFQIPIYIAGFGAALFMFKIEGVVGIGKSLASVIFFAIVTRLYIQRLKGEKPE